MGLLAQIRAIVQPLGPELEAEEEMGNELLGVAVHGGGGGAEEFDFGEVVKREDLTKEKERDFSQEDEEVLKPPRPKTKKRNLAEKDSKKVKVHDTDSSSPRKKKRRKDE